MNPVKEIRTEAVPFCCVCGASGARRYTGLRDRLFAAPGEWSLAKCSNPECGTHWLDPRATLDDLSCLYANYYTHGGSDAAVQPSRTKGLLKRYWQRACAAYLHQKYGYLPTAKPTSIDAILAMIIKTNPVWCADLDFSVFYLPRHEGGKLLEVGFGSGAMLQDMSNRGWSVSGVDFDEKAVETARRKGLNVSCGSLADQNFPAGSFDAVVMSHVIEHVPNPEEVLRECHRILKDGGVLVLITPNVDGVVHHRFGAATLHLDPPRHLNLFSARSFGSFLSRVGFAGHKVSTSVRDAGNLWMASLSIERTGRFEWGSITGTWKRLMAALHAWRLGMRYRFDSSCGDELVAIATKHARS